MIKARDTKSLFKATRRKPARGEQIFDDLPAIEREATGSARADDDFYPTPPEPTLAFCHAEGERLRQLGRPIWEMAAGNGAMARAIQSCGFEVLSSDAVDRKFPGCELRSFYDYQQPLSSVGITNPPYQEVNWRDGNGRWLLHALETLQMDYLALLLAWAWPGAAGLAKIWDDHPPARVYLMRWKIDFTGEGAPPVLNAWFVWDGPTQPGDTRLLMLDRWRDPRQTTLL